MDGVVRIMTEHSPEVVRFYHLKDIACDVTIASMFLILYDSFLTIGQEVGLVWPSPWSPPKVVYILRSLAADALHPGMAIYQLSTWFGWFSLMMVQLVIQTWLYALFRKNRQIILSLAAVYLTFGALTFTSIFLSMSRIRIVGHSPVCTALRNDIEVGPTFRDLVHVASHTTSIPPFIEATLLPSLFYSIVMTALLTYKAAVTFYTRSDHKYNLATVLIRDSTICCTVIALVSIVNSLLITVMPADLIQAGVGFGIALPSIISSRMLLDLRDADEKRNRITDVQGVRVSQWETMFHI